MNIKQFNFLYMVIGYFLFFISFFCLLTASRKIDDQQPILYPVNLLIIEMNILGKIILKNALAGKVSQSN